MASWLLSSETDPMPRIVLLPTEGRRPAEWFVGPYAAEWAEERRSGRRTRSPIVKLQTGSVQGWNLIDQLLLVTHDCMRPSRVRGH